MKQKTEHQKIDEISEIELLHHVKLSINPKFQDWVLFKNGTYIIFEHADEISNLQSKALKLIKEFGPVYTERSEDFDVTDLKNTEGWIVSGHGYGIYTYVSSQEMKSKKPNTATIGLLGRGKRDLDGRNPVIVHVNRKTKKSQ
ncbi:hypothetical protein EYY60_03880 [Flavobacterium zhairuonense]|uniref:hypothetical protein n=1 Tax=Flavobacterium zhairuonense TaxID=2493631 RepID=UPI00104528F2|nr:hypothetical protein [Flavobacterium zhairuonense]KAF2514404.1 hypothetical protein EYY60_03880 [Flavobacterium zhairuonense]